MGKVTPNPSLKRSANVRPHRNNRLPFAVYTEDLFKMATKSVQSLVEDFRLISETNYQIVEAVRALVKKKFKSATEEVKYGGILFTSGVQFCGVFAYKEHVSVEFGAGAKITDDIGLLEGSGKGRRHLKLKTLAEIKDKKLAEYLTLAHKAASGV